MTIDKQKLKALAEALIKATDDWQEREQDNELGDLWDVADDNFTEACTPSIVLTLLAEIERLERKNANQAESIREYQDLTMGGDVSLGMLKADIRVTAGERDQLKAENEALRQLKLPHYLKLSDEMRAAGDHAELRAREDQCYSVPVLKAVFFQAAIQRWLDDQEEAIELAMAKEASHG